MTKALLSDLHAHKWSRFSTIGKDGVSSRLEIILSEFKRAAKELLDAGGDTMVIAGDVFHVRGSIEPSVFNPTHSAVVEVLGMGIRIIIIPGNHDLEGRNSTKIGNAMQTFASLEGVTVCTEDTYLEEHGLLMMPWYERPEDLLGALDTWSIDLGDDREHVDVIMHAGIDGVLPGMPDHGLTAKKLQEFGFRRIFAGHYHNHKEVAEGVISIGATTQQTFGDIGTKAGFLLFDENTYRYRASHAPSFVQIDETTDLDEVDIIADGNYVRVTGIEMDDATIDAFRKDLIASGARGVSFQVPRKVANVRASAAAKKGMTLEQSVDAFVKTLKSDHEEEVSRRCATILTNVQSVTDEAA